MDIYEFEAKLKHFLEEENHPYRSEIYEIDYDLVIGYLNMISGAHLNNCYVFDHDGNALMIFLDCYSCGKQPCHRHDLDFLLKEFKKVYRRGIK